MTVTLGAIVVLVLGATLMIDVLSVFAQTESRSMASHLSYYNVISGIIMPDLKIFHLF